MTNNKNQVINNTSASYRGVVTVSVVSQNKVVYKTVEHNEGTPWLFYVLSSALVGMQISNNIPQFIKPYYGTTSASAPIPIGDRYLDYDAIEGTYQAVFTCTIPVDVLTSSGNLSEFAIFSSLLSEDYDSYKLATVLLSTPIDTSALSSGQFIIVEWRMIFANLLSWQAARVIAPQISITCSVESPESPVLGDYWYDTTGGSLNVYDNTGWVSSPQPFSYGAVAPIAPSLNDWWYNTANNKLFIYA